MFPSVESNKKNELGDDDNNIDKNVKNILEQNQSASASRLDPLTPNAWEKNYKHNRLGRVQTVVEDKDEKSDRNQPKVLTGTIKLPQVFGHSNATRDISRLNYNFKPQPPELPVEKASDKLEASENLFLRVIKRPKVYQKIEVAPVSSRQLIALEALVDQPQPKFERELPKRDRTSRSCPRPFSIDRGPAKSQLIPAEKTTNQVRIRNNTAVPSNPEVTIKYLSVEELPALENPQVVLKGLESSLNDDQDWQTLFSSINDIRSLLKFNSQLVIDSSSAMQMYWKRLCQCILSMRSSVSKNSLLALQEALTVLGPSGSFNKNIGFLFQHLCSKLADTNAFLLTEVEKCLQSIIQYCPANKIVSQLLAAGEHRSPVVKTHVLKCFLKLFERLKQEAFMCKEYDRIILLISSTQKDANPDVRGASRDALKYLSELSDQPDLVLRAVAQLSQSPSYQQQPITASTLTNQPLTQSIRVSEVFGKLNEDPTSPPAQKRAPNKNSGIKVKRIGNNKIATQGPQISSIGNLNRTEEIIGLQGLSIRPPKPLLPMATRDQPDTDESSPKPALSLVGRSDLMHRRKPPPVAKSYPELECVPELMKDMETEDWQGKVESLKVIVELTKEHLQKFLKSVHLVKFFDLFLKLLADPNGKMQQEALHLLSGDLRPVFTALPERLLSLLIESLFRLQGSTQSSVSTLAAECLIQQKNYPDKRILRSTLNRQYVNISIKAKSNFAKFLANNASRIDEPTMNFIQPILAFNVRNAHTELKRLNEILFKELLSCYGEKLYSQFDEKCRELIQSILGQSLPPQTTSSPPPVNVVSSEANIGSKDQGAPNTSAIINN